MGLSFTIAAGPRQRSHSQVRVTRDSWPYFAVSDSRLPQPGGPGPRIYILQEHGGPVIPPGTGFPFRRLLRLAGLQWRYSNQPPRGPLHSFHYMLSIWYSTNRVEDTASSSSFIVLIVFFAANVFTEPLPSNMVKGVTHRQQGEPTILILFFPSKRVGYK
jgi:hypothetical protein